MKWGGGEGQGARGGGGGWHSKVALDPPSADHEAWPL